MDASYTDFDLSSTVGAESDYDTSMDYDSDSKMDGENAKSEQRVPGLVRSICF